MVITRFAVQPPKTPGMITTIQKISELTMDKGRKKNSICFKSRIQRRQPLCDDPSKEPVAGVTMLKPSAHACDQAHVVPNQTADTHHTLVAWYCVRVSN